MVRKSANLLPAFFRTEKNNKFLSSTLDQFIQQPSLERLDGFIGSKLSKNYNPSTDQYINSGQSLRDKYQLEPALIIKEQDGSVKRAYGVDDLINQISFYGGNVDNLDRLFKPDVLSFDPNIDWDKLVNFKEYYWVPMGPSPVKITGTQREVTSTYTIDKSDTGDYFIFTPDSLTPNPQITLYRGVTYVFTNNSDNKFYIKSTSGAGAYDLYNTDVLHNGSSNGNQIIFSVTETTPNILYYATDSNDVAIGQFVIKTIDENSYINVEREIIGKADYTSSTGVKFINGLKISFSGDVTPEYYKNKDFIVEGVGNAIELVDFATLETPESVATQYDVDFDAENFDNFPFDNFKNIPLDPSYITINRSSKDRNPWTRYNRWFHKDVIQAINPTAELPVDNRAKRPIIEFKPNIQLFNFGNRAVANVDLIDTTTKDVFSDVEKSLGYWVDNVELEEGFRVIFNADPDPLVKGRIFEVSFVKIDGELRINLTEAADGVPVEGSCSIITRGKENAGVTWWYTSAGVWQQAQIKTTINQAPLFDVFDSDGNSFGGSPYTNDFIGTKVFGYTIGSNTSDSVLGFPLKYKSIGIESSYLFSNYFNTDVINRVYPDISIVNNVSEGFLKLNDNVDAPQYVNVWRDSVDYSIPVIQFQEYFTEVSQIEITVFDNPATIDDLTFVVFVNDTKYTNFSTSTEANRLYINFDTAILENAEGTRIKIECYSKTSPNSTGIYQTPINITNNPLNGPVAELTLSELYDHVNTMVDRDARFEGEFPGTGNIGQLPDIAKYGTRIISSKNPASLAHYFISNKDYSLISSIKKASDDYSQFKLNLIKFTSYIEDYSDIPAALDLIMVQLNENKATTFPYFLSDMLPYGTNKKTRTYTVTDSRNVEYSITSIFDPATITNRGIIVYLNGRQLIIDKEYEFQKYDPAVTIKVEVVSGDVILIEEYIDTDGCYVPPTPTKLGLYPKFEPMKYLDSSYADEPRYVIQGHDGSLTVAFNDYRDDIILEYETRVYNNLKINYKPELFDINIVLPGVFRTEEYSYDEVYNLIQTVFLRWAGFYGIDYEANSMYDVDNHKTYNFKSAVDSIFDKSYPGSWRAIYKYYFDTDRPDTHPWEMLGITIKPDWWDEQYGPAPYTSGNSPLWEDLELGRIAQGTNAGINPLYARPGLSEVIPVDDEGNLLDIRYWAGIGSNDSVPDTDQKWSFGSWGPAENAWRRSSVWPFAVQLMCALAKPADYASKCFDTSRMNINLAGQYTYSDANQLLSPLAISQYLFSDLDSNGTVIRAGGYGVYVIEVGKIRNRNFVSLLKDDLEDGIFNLFVKLGGFVSKEKLSILIDSSQISSQNPSPYLPSEDYKVHFNTSNPIKTLAISGVIVIKKNGKFVVRGYDKQDLFFKIYNPVHQLLDPTIKIGEKSEEFVNWTTNQYYVAGQIVFYQSSYFRVLSSHNSLTSFVEKYYTPLSVLPSTGGIRVQSATKFETKETVVLYGTEYSTIQEVYDFLIGYSKWLTTEGFIFDDYNSDFLQTIDWNFSAKEFIYWTTQNWADNSVITLSPFANQLKFEFQDGVVDNIFDSFYEYSLLRANGTAFPSKNFGLVRDGNTFTLKTRNTYDGLFYVKLNIVQKEHTLVFNNSTIFSDVLYEINSGYRQSRVKVKGFRTAEWNGDFVSPGFVYDSASIQPWEPYKNYIPGDVVEYVGKYYSSKAKITGTETFNFSDWVVLNEKPTAQLLPNFEYKINQFEDFYSLDIDNFDIAQQMMAQHLIGYTSRPYLENIFDNPVSQYKFYQGFIKEKGTKNAISKLEKASAANLQGSIEFNEEWAFRSGYFGSYSSYNELEAPLKEGDFIESNQIVSFVDSVPSEQNKLISYITADELTIKPSEYVSTATFKTRSTTFDTDLFALPTAGYPRLDDVQYTYKTYDDLLTIEDNSNIQDGDKFWIGFVNDFDWTVLRYTRHLRFVTHAETAIEVTGIKFTTNKYHGLKVGDIISVAAMDTSVNGVYKIAAVPELNQFEVESETTAIPADLPVGQLFTFAIARFSNVDNISEMKNILDINDTEIFWVDNFENNSWAAIKKVDNYDFLEKTAPRNKPGQQYGYRIAKQNTTGTVVVSANQFYDEAGGYGRIYVYELDNNTLNPVINYALNSGADEYASSTDKAGFGDNLFYDDTDDIIFAAASKASFVTADVTGFVREARGTNDPAPYSNMGLVKISGVWTKGVHAELPYAVLSDPNPKEYSNFGSGLFVQRSTGTKSLFVGAPGSTNPNASNTSTGVVYRYNLEISDAVREYNEVTGTNPIISASGAKFDVSIVDRTYSATLYRAGTGYNTSSYSNSIITIPGTSLGGKAPHNNLFIKILSTGTYGSISSFEITTSSRAAIKSFEITTATQFRLPVGGNIMPPLTIGSRFGYKVVGTKDASKLAVSAPGYDNGKGAVYVYDYNSNTDEYDWIQSIVTIGPEFENKVRNNDFVGSSLAMNEDGSYLFVGSDKVDDFSAEPGKVYVYKKLPGGTYEFIQKLDNPGRENNLQFGHEISISEDATKLAISSLGDNFFVSGLYDNGKTTFDGGSCVLGDVVRDSGTVYVYDRYNELFLLSQELFDGTVDADSNYGESILATNDTIYVGSPNSIVNNNPNGSIYFWNEIESNKNSWEVFRQQTDLIDTDTIRKTYTYDSLSEKLLEYLDIIDPIKGKIPGFADQEIRYKTPFDPATYNVGSTSTVTSDSVNYWSNLQVGELWWDLSTAKYVWYEQGDIVYRKATWGTLFPGASIDVYEWVETTYPPSDWAALADTNAGTTQGISGQPKFADDSVYSIKQVYDKSINQFVTLYYYWVKNKAIVPNVGGRRISAYEVSSAISDPKSYGLKYASVISPNAISVVNFKNSLISDRIYLNIGFDNLDSEINKHTEWTLLQEGNENSILPKHLENKMIDSLLGKDALGQIVPDPNLPDRLKYGIELRPRQSMFKDRFEALRTLIEYSNSVLKETLVRDLVDFDNLNSKEEIPDEYLGEYDSIYEDIEGRDSIDSSVLGAFKRAEIACAVINGRITSVSIIEPGYGYKIAPTVTVLNDESGAKIKTFIDPTTGSVSNVAIINPGRGFVTPPSLLVRAFTVIIQSDIDYNGKWSKYEWTGDEWSRIHTQKYDTTKYWYYVDWSDSTYNKFHHLVSTVEESYELVTLDLIAGDYVKVKNPGDGLYIILRKVDSNGTFNNDFDLVYKEQGTIQVDPSVYDTVTAQLGFDNVTTFDQLLFDQTAETELRYILMALKDDIFDGPRRIYRNKFFFKAIKYALTEQKLLDWAFKTSFINVRNLAGVLDQRTTYRFQDPTWYENYLKEIKPYHTNIRNYQVNYQVGESQDTPWEPSYTYTTDFDLPVVYNKATESFNTVTNSSSLIDTYPYKGWADNHTYEVESIEISYQGSGYRTIPKVDIIAAAGDTGTGATAIAYIAYGKVIEIEVTNPGTGYTKTPTVLISGGGDTNLEYALAYARLSNKKVRTNSVNIKFDRIATNAVSTTTAYYSTTTNGTTYKFDLPWYASTNKDLISIKLDGIMVLDPDYTINNYTAAYLDIYGSSYTKKFSQLILDEVPYKGQLLEMWYEKNIELYSASERVQQFYDPATGMPGTTLAQVMEGVEYPGLKLDTLPLSHSTTWDQQGFGVGSWDDNVDGTADLDSLIDGGRIDYTTARGVRPNDVIIDGDGLVTPFTSYAPEEVVPGQVQESVSISVFTRSDQGSPVIVSQSSLITSVTSATTIDLRLQPANTSSVMVSYNNVGLVYGRDFSVNFVNKTVTINTQTTTGVADITIVTVGGTEMIGSYITTVESTSTAVININALVADIGSIYVTANGKTLSATNDNSLGYNLKPISSSNAKGRLTVTGLTDDVTVVQAWTFKPTYKAYSEVKEQIITVSSTASTFTLIQPPGELGPFHAQVVVELNGLRLTPPDTTYYQIVDNDTLVFDIRPDEVDPPGLFDLSQLEVYLNGVLLESEIDYLLDQPNNQISFNPSFLAIGDVLAITALVGSEYTINSAGELVLSGYIQPSDTLKVITYTNADSSNIRTEVINASSSKDYKISRTVLDSNYVWVSIAGKPLVNDKDYTVLEDRRTVRINKRYRYKSGDKIIITSFDSIIASTTVGFRIFKDMLGRTHYKRLSEMNTAYLSQDLLIDDTEILVDDASRLPVPNISQNVPGIVFIAGERVEYMEKVGNTLGKLRRGTLGTGVRSVYLAGTAIVDSGKTQTIPTTEEVFRQDFTTTNATSYVLTDIPFDDVSYIDVNGNEQQYNVQEIDVYYAGRKLHKPTYSAVNDVVRYQTDTTAYYDSSVLTDDQLAPEFTIELSTTSQYVLMLNLPIVEENKRLTVVKHKARIWYTPGDGTATDGNSLLESNTVQAEFLQERQSGLPDKYHYGQI